MRQGLLIALLLAAGGCASGSLRNPQTLVRPETFSPDNQITITPSEAGPAAYAVLFDRVLDVIDDYFDIESENRYDGRIVAKPRICPGIEQPWKPGSPDFFERALATAQTYRHRSFVLIQPSEDGGYIIGVTVFKELEDLPKPSRDSAGGANFRSTATIERQFEIVDPSIVDTNWIPKGRDFALEQKILNKIQRQLRSLD
jgi:hypothetical protein